MQLGANKVPSSIAAAVLAEEWTQEAAADSVGNDNPWGSDDLIDVNADEDDWSTCFILTPA